MKINDLDWQFLTSNIGYTSTTWYAEVPGGAIVRYDVVEGADERAMVFVPNFLT